MKPTKPVPLIEVIESEMPIAGHDGIVKFKGKVLHPEVLTFCDYEYVHAEMPAEILFDFNAGDLPDLITFGVSMANDECLGLLDNVCLNREKRYVEMEFSFEIDNQKPPKVDLNPFVTLAALAEIVKKDNYKMRTYTEPFGFGVSFAIPFSDNVYSHYKKHLAAFEKLCRPIEKDIIKRLNKRFKGN